MTPYHPIPRPEYPRPDRQRGQVEGVDWLNLNGPWQFRFDQNRSGVTSRWQNGQEDWQDQIIVPFCWESLAAWGEGDGAGNDHYYSTRCFVSPVDVTKENHRSAERYEVGWYKREILVPQDGAWEGKRVILTIGAADFFTDCWCNGVHLGHHEGGYVPIEFDLTDALSDPEPDGSRRGLLVVRVEDPMDNREQPVGKQWGWYTTTSGIWQTVFVEPRAAQHVKSFRIIPDIDTSSVSFEATCVGRDSDMRVTVEIAPPQGESLTIDLEGERELVTGEAELHPLVLWDTNNPQLHHVVFKLSDAEGKTLDEVRGYFGMRKISTSPADDGPSILCLNNEPIYLRGALYQSYHPEGVYTAANAATLYNDLAFAMRMGFDFLRIHIKLDDPILLYYADTLGILLMQDFPNFGEGGDTPLGRRRFEEMMRAGFERDFNHPSIISWCIFNETWGFGGQSELMKLISPDMPPAPERGEPPIETSTSFQWIHKMWQLAKTLDQTRLIEDMSVVVWEHLASYGHVETDVNSWHFYINDYKAAKEHIEEVVAKTYHGSDFNYIEGFSQQNVPLISSEYGGVGALDGDRDISWSFKFLTNELRRHGQLSAYIFTQLMDVEWEFNGFMNYDRTPKAFGYPPAIINQGNVLPINAPPISRVTPGETVKVEVLSSHFSRTKQENVLFRWQYSGMDSLGKIHSNLARGHSPIPFGHQRVELAKVIEVTLPNEPMLCTLTVAAVTPDGKTVASNYIQQYSSNGPPPEREERDRTLVLRRRVDQWSASNWSGGDGGRDAAIADGSCYGTGAGFFEWEFAVGELDRLQEAFCLRFLMEASSRRDDTPQTDDHRYASQFSLAINGITVLRNLLPDHPHDSRGALSYLRGGKGAYGYLLHATVEEKLLDSVRERAMLDGRLLIRTSVSGAPSGGLTIYGSDCGRYPACPTLMLQSK